MRTIAFILVLLSLPAGAGEVYKCKGADGSITFTNIKCPEKAAIQHYGTYTPAADAPDPYVASNRRAPVINEPMKQQGGDDVQEPARTSDGAAGYQCSATGRIWIQATPCPPTSVRYTSTSVSGTDSFTGRPLHGTVSVPSTVEVKQRQLDRDELCSQLESNPATAERGKGKDSSYERRKMRGNNGCR